MASRAQVTLRGRFSPGTTVRLVKVRDERALRAEGGDEKGTAVVDKDGMVQFTSGVQEGARYFIVGQVDGTHLEVRARGRSADDDSEVLAQAPIGRDRVRLSDGSFLDEPPTKESPPSVAVTVPGQRQVPKGVVQRSDTPRGTAHPVDTSEKAPYRSQEDVPDGVVQMSDTPGFTNEITGQKVSGGAATEIVSSVQRQEDSAGILQRSDTPHGTTVPLPGGDIVKAQLERESAAAKESRGEPVRAASEPLGTLAKGPKRKRSRAKAPAKPLPGADNDRDIVSGHDAQGQPVAADVAAAAGISPAEKPLETGKRGTSLGDAKAADVAGDPLERLDDPPQEAGASKTEDATTGAGKARPSDPPKLERTAKPKRSRSRAKAKAKPAKSSPAKRASSAARPAKSSTSTTAKKEA